MNASIDVLAVFSKLVCHGGLFEPRHIVPNWNIPRSTGLIASNLRFRPRDHDGKVVVHKTPTTATVLRALERAKRDGMVCDAGTGTENRNTWRDLSAAESRERYWVLTDAAMSRIEAEL